MALHSCRGFDGRVSRAWSWRYSLQRWLISALLLFLVPSFTSLAQTTGKLTGFVTDAETDVPLVGANVILHGTLVGIASDLDGRFTLLGVPVGKYDVAVSYVGYQPILLEGVEINAGYTNDLGHLMLTPGLELDAVVVQYERPLLQKDAVGVPKIVTGTEIIYLPVRGVNEIVAIQPGIASVEGREEIHARGGRSQEVTYMIDGVKVISDNLEGVGAIGIPQAAIQEQEMLIGNISARYGDVMSGVVNVTTKSGRPAFFGSVEALTSRGLDPYGTSILSGSLGGPVSGEKLNFFVSGEVTTAEDGAPRAVKQLRLDQAEIDRLESSPQALSVILADGTESWIEFPGSLESGAQLPIDDEGNIIVGEDGSIVASDGTMIQLPTGAGLAPSVPIPVNAWEATNPALFELDNIRRSAGITKYSGTANMTYRPVKAIRVRVGGRGAFSRSEQIGQREVLFAPESYTEIENVQWQGFANWMHYLSAKTFYQLQLDYGNRLGWRYDTGFSRDVENLLSYGDIDHTVNEVSSRFKKLLIIDGIPTYVPLFQDSGNVAEGTIATQPGGTTPGYSKSSSEQWRFSASAISQVGIHQLEFGGEFERLIHRRWSISAYGAQQLAKWLDDSASCTVGTCGAESTVDADGDGLLDVVLSYDQIPEQSFFETEYYGYDARGLRVADSENILDFYDGDNLDVGPWRPIYYGVYVQDKIEFRDIVLNLGIRLDVFDNNARVLRDPYARVPIVRANRISGTPPGIGDDFAVYFDGDNVVGYRDLNGRFYDNYGEIVPAAEVVEDGTVDDDPIQALTDPVERRAEWEVVFEDYDPQFSVMPRIGISFPVTDRSLFFGRYGIVSQRPSVNNYASLALLLDRNLTFLPNPNLRPEQTVEYEIGFRQRIADRIALTFSGFFRQIEDLETIRPVQNAYPYTYYTSQNVDFGTVKGIEIDFDLRRTGNVSLNANYSLSLAEGTGSEAPVRLREVLGGLSPIDTIVPLEFDQRHRFNLSIDIRFGDGEGPVVRGMRILQDTGLNVLVQAGSGFPYTKLFLEDLADLSVGSVPQGKINAHRMPASGRIDLRIDRDIRIGRRATISVFLWIQNLLDASNVFQVYDATGLPDEDGFRLSPDGQVYLQNQLRPQTADIIYGHRIRNPEHYGIPRMIRLGARLTF